MSQAQQRLGAISSSLSHPKGLLAGEVAIVTGAAQGIGREVALLFAKEGAKVVVSDLDPKKAQVVAEEIKKNGGEAIVVGGDVTGEGFAKKLIEETVKAFGGINHIINNAGFTFDKMLHTSTDEGYRLMLEVHNVAPFKIVREAAPYMRGKKPEDIKKNKSIVNVSSVAGLHGNVGQANYATAKAGIIGLTKTIAKEWGAFNVRANTVAFGHVETRLTQAKELGEAIEVNGQKIALGIPSGPKKADNKPETYPHSGSFRFLPSTSRSISLLTLSYCPLCVIVPLARPGTASEAAKAVLFLASPLASYVDGHTLEVTGGMMI